MSYVTLDLQVRRVDHLLGSNCLCLWAADYTISLSILSFDLLVSPVSLITFPSQKFWRCKAIGFRATSTARTSYIASASEKRPTSCSVCLYFDSHNCCCRIRACYSICFIRLSFDLIDHCSSYYTIVNGIVFI